MRAIAYDGFGGPEVLAFGDQPDPILQPHHALIRVRAAGVNHLEARIRTGDLAPYFNHLMPIVPGADFAGEVAAVGMATEGFAPGDRVFGFGMKDYVGGGTYAELVAVPERLLAHAPDEVSFADLAALPTSGLAAWQSLDLMRVGPGDSVLISAAAGGVGHLAVQLARLRGAATVIGTASPGNHDFVRSLGAEPVTYGPGLEGRVAEILGGDGRVDAVLDLVGEATLDSSFAVARVPSRVVCLNPSSVEARGGRLWTACMDRSALVSMAESVRAGALRVEIAEQIPLAEAASAHERIEGNHVRGKLVLQVP